MTLQITEEQRMLLQDVKEFCRREVTSDFIRRLDEEEEYPVDLFKKMGDLGWLGIPFPGEYGGADGDLMTMLRVIEELSYGALVAGNVYFRNVVNGGLNILRGGTNEQRHRFLPGLISGELLFAFGMTEPDAGSDVRNMRTTAIDKGDHYVINGTKIFLSGAAISHWIQLFAVTEGERNPDRPPPTSVFMVDTKSEGIEYQKINKLGNKPMRTYFVTFDDVEVPKDLLLGGEPNRGWSHVLAAVNIERVAIAMECVGCAQRVVDDALKYARERVQFGRPISKFQAIQHKLADMQVQVDAARLLTYRAASVIADGEGGGKEAAMAKLYASDAYTFCALEGIQVLGGYGYTKDFDMERHYRDAPLYRIGPGTNELMKNLIANKMGC